MLNSITVFYNTGFIGKGKNLWKKFQLKMDDIQRFFQPRIPFLEYGKCIGHRKHSFYHVTWLMFCNNDIILKFPYKDVNSYGVY